MAKTPARARPKRSRPIAEEIHDPIDFEPTTPLGLALKEARRRIIAAGIPFLAQEEFERELAERRGGVRDDE